MQDHPKILAATEDQPQTLHRLCDDINEILTGVEGSLRVDSIRVACVELWHDRPDHRRMVLPSSRAVEPAEVGFDDSRLAECSDW